jgi:hypothetical protein
MGKEATIEKARFNEYKLLVTILIELTTTLAHQA